MLTISHGVFKRGGLTSASMGIDQFIDSIIVQLLVADDCKLKPFCVPRVGHCCPLSLEVDIIIDFHFVAPVDCLEARLEGGRNNARFPLFSSFLNGFDKLRQLAIYVLAVCGILDILPSLAFLDFTLLDEECVNFWNICERCRYFRSPPVCFP